MKIMKKLIAAAALAALTLCLLAGCAEKTPGRRRYKENACYGDKRSVSSL